MFFLAKALFPVLVILLLQGCQDDREGSAGNQILQSPYAMNSDEETADKDSLTVNTTDTTAAMQGKRSGRIPDFSVRVRNGSALVLETDGLKLTATGESVKHRGVYSVTTLTAHELPPMPQGMVNMTAPINDSQVSTVNSHTGYRLLPSGDHFDPPAELRIAYDPARLPPATLPTTSTPPILTAPRWHGCASSALPLTPRGAR